MNYRIHCNCTSFEINDSQQVEAPEYWHKASTMQSHWFCEACEIDVSMQSISEENDIDATPDEKSIRSITDRLSLLNEPYTTNQVADILGYASGNSVRKLIERKQLKSIKRGNMNLLFKRDVLDFVATHGVYK